MKFQTVSHEDAKGNAIFYPQTLLCMPCVDGRHRREGDQSANGEVYSVSTDLYPLCITAWHDVWKASARSTPCLPTYRRAEPRSIWRMIEEEGTWHIVHIPCKPEAKSRSHEILDNRRGRNADELLRKVVVPHSLLPQHGEVCPMGEKSETEGDIDLGERFDK